MHTLGFSSNRLDEELAVKMTITDKILNNPTESWHLEICYWNLCKEKKQINAIPHVKLFYYSIMLCVQWAGMLLVICGLVTVGVNDLIHTKVTNSLSVYSSLEITLIKLIQKCNACHKMFREFCSGL